MTKICNLNDISNNQSLGLSTSIDGMLKKLIIVRSKKGVFAYVNSCPHIGAPLDLRPGQFLSHNKENIFCSTHGALFQIDTGLCIFGPCKDAYLETVPINIEHNGDLYVQN
jgi:nitrite reductase/ring-hydroxylating ferredoxin subunit